LTRGRGQRRARNASHFGKRRSNFCRPTPTISSRPSARYRGSCWVPPLKERGRWPPQRRQGAGHPALSLCHLPESTEGIVVVKPRTAEWVLVTPKGEPVGCLSAVSVATPWWPDIEPVVQAVRDHRGIDVIVLLLARRRTGTATWRPSDISRRSRRTRTRGNSAL